MKSPDFAMMLSSQTGVFSYRTPRNVTASRCGPSPLWCGPQTLKSIIVGFAYSACQYDFTWASNRLL